MGLKDTKNMKDKMANMVQNIGEKSSELALNTVNVTKKTGEIVASRSTEVAKKTTETVAKSKEVIFNSIDQNGDGEIGIDNVIIMGLKTPGIKINRETYLRKEFFKKFPEDVIDAAIETNPMKAGIPQKEIEKIVDEVIKYERVCVSGISAALSAPGGAAMVATIPADLAQYYGYMLRATQKMLYLYGFPEIDLEEKGQFIQ